MPKTTEQVEGGGSKVHRWPVMELVRAEGDGEAVPPWVPSPGENDLNGFAVETYIPVSALLSDEAAEAAARFRQEDWRESAPGIGATRWGELPPSRRDAALALARRELQALVNHLGGTDAH